MQPVLYVITIFSHHLSAHNDLFLFVSLLSWVSSSVRILQQNAFPASVAVRMSNFTGKPLQVVPVIILPGPLPPPPPRSVAVLALRGCRLISMISSSPPRRPCRLSAPSLVQTRSSIPNLPLTLPPLLTLQIGRLQTCPSCHLPWHLMQTWLQNTMHRPSSFDVLVLPYFPITLRRCSRVCMPSSNNNHHRVTGTLPGVNLELTPPWMIPSHLMAWQGHTRLGPRNRLRLHLNSMVLVSLALPTAPGRCLWNLVIAAVRPRNLSLPALPLRACIFLFRGARCLMLVRRRCRGKPTTHISCNINAAALYPPLNHRLFLVRLSLLSHLCYSKHNTLEKAVSPLRLVSCPSTIPMCSLVFLLMGFRSSPTLVWVYYLTRPIRRRCRRVCNMPSHTKAATVGCRPARYPRRG